VPIVSINKQRTEANLGDLLQGSPSEMAVMDA